MWKQVLKRDGLTNILGNSEESWRGLHRQLTGRGLQGVRLDILFDQWVADVPDDVVVAIKERSVAFGSSSPSPPDPAC